MAEGIRRRKRRQAAAGKSGDSRGPQRGSRAGVVESQHSKERHVFAFVPNSARLWLIPLLLCASAPCYFGQEPVSTSPPGTAPIEWVTRTRVKRVGARRFRLQIANDERFRDVIFDGVVTGSKYVAKDLNPGRYFWRVAPAAARNRRFPKFARFEVKSAGLDKPPSSVSNTSSIRPVAPGWFATTGEISTPMAAQLRAGSGLDFIGVNSEGTVYALDARRGIALWTARYQPHAKSGLRSPMIGKQFLPLIVGSGVGINEPLIIVAYEKGLRALEGANGREIWASELSGKFVGGLAADMDDRAGPEIYLTDESQNELVVLDPKSGRVKSVSKLSGKPSGAPVLLTTKSSRVLLVALEGNALEVRKHTGEFLRSIKIESPITTSPLVVEAARGVLLLIGTRDGLAAFDTAEFRPLESLAIENDYPIGSLSVADIDGDKKADMAVLVTNLGRVAKVDIAAGAIEWIVEGFGGANGAAFADLNGDGRPELLLPGKDSFAIGLSVDNGSKIWESASVNQGNQATRNSGYARRLATATMKDGPTMIVGDDASSMGLRAVELTTGVAPSAQLGIK